MINRQYATSFICLLGLICQPCWAQLKLTRNLSDTSKTAGVSTLVGGAASSLPAPSKADLGGLQEVDYIVAIVNSEPITRNDVLVRQSRILAQWAAQGIRPPANEDVFKRTLERMIEERAIVQVAKESGIRVTDDQLGEALSNIARQNQLPSIRALQEKYEAEGGNWSLYREDIRQELLLLQAREREVDNRVRISETEIDAALRDQKIATYVTQDLNLAQILIALPDSPSAQAIQTAKGQAAQIVQRLRAGEDFGKLVAQYSNASDKAIGGTMGLRPADRYPALFVEAVQSLKKGEITEPFQSGAGFHILKVLEKTQTQSSSVTQTRVRHILLPITKDMSEIQAINRLSAFKNQIELNQTSFIAVAKDHSLDPSAAQGGDLGWVAAGMFVPEFESAMAKLKVGEISQPVVSRFGVHLIEVTDRKEVALGEREQRAQIRNQLRDKKASDAYTTWIAEVRNRAYVEYR